MGNKTKNKKAKSTTARGEYFSTRNFGKGFRARLIALKGEGETLESVHNRTVAAGLRVIEELVPVTLEQVVEVEDQTRFKIPESVEETLEEVGSMGYEFLEEVRG